MRGCLVVLVTVIAATLVGLPRASAGDVPIGHLGDTLRVDTGKYIADVAVSSVQPVDPPPGFGYNRVGIPVKSFPNSAVMRADVAIHAIRVPTPYQMLTDFTFGGGTPFGDAYKSRASDAPDALANVPTGSIVRGGVYWEAYRDPVSTVVLLDKKTGYHLAQWNL
jgi:hypothetical protein